MDIFYPAPDTYNPGQDRGGLVLPERSALSPTDITSQSALTLPVGHSLHPNAVDSGIIDTLCLTTVALLFEEGGLSQPLKLSF
jgi:hypothetical protein